jgi:hypothetical protein
MSLMMMKTNPITPPRELVREWYGSEDCPDGANALANYLCTQAAQWGADQELEACCAWLAFATSEPYINALRAARRPKPPSLKEQALAELGDAYDEDKIDDTAYDTIRRALEATND